MDLLLDLLKTHMTWGWVGNVFLLSAAWRLGKKHRDAFVLSILSSICWLHDAFEMGRPDWVFIEIVTFFIAIRNFIYWGRDARATVDVPGGAAKE